MKTQKKTTHKLEMLTPSVNLGLNNTIRSGDKWLKAETGDELEVYRTGTKDLLYRATVIASNPATVDQLRPEVLKFNHSPKARTFLDLDKQMCKAYGKEWVMQPIVVLWFWVDAAF